MGARRAANGAREEQEAFEALHLLTTPWAQLKAEEGQDTPKQLSLAPQPAHATLQPTLPRPVHTNTRHTDTHKAFPSLISSISQQKKRFSRQFPTITRFGRRQSTAPFATPICPPHFSPVTHTPTDRSASHHDDDDDDDDDDKGANLPRSLADPLSLEPPPPGASLHPLHLGPLVHLESALLRQVSVLEVGHDGLVVLHMYMIRIFDYLTIC
jgi:hypothetical protein